MPELMTKQDAIVYLLYMKHDVQAKSPMDIALDTAIEALKQPAIEPEVRHGRWKFGSKADNACVIPFDLKFYCTCCGKEAIRDYDDTQVLSDFCPNCGAKMYADGETISKERFAEIMGGANND